MMVRAVFVPSPPVRTAVLTALVGVPVVVGNSLGFQRESFAVLQQFVPAPLSTMVAVESSAWWLLTVAVCTVTSRVLYGLRREVREARQLGQYLLEEKLGEGGMGVVYRARHAMLRRPTAVKLLPADKSSESTIARFEREVRLTARLAHPNTVTVYDYGRTPEGVFYYAMELLEGANLREVVDVEGPLPPARVLHVLEQVAASLVEAHGIGLIHRDIKPANILLCEIAGAPDVAKVVDFGLVKEVERGGDASLTTAGTLTGTPLYMAPEAITAPETLDARSDLYALGAVGYFLLVGVRRVHRPFGRGGLRPPPALRAGATVGEDRQPRAPRSRGGPPVLSRQGAPGAARRRERPATAAEGLRRLRELDRGGRPASGGSGTRKTSPNAGGRPPPACPAAASSSTSRTGVSRKRRQNTHP